MQVKATIHEYLEKIPTRRGPRLVQLAIMLIIVVNVAAVVVETVSVPVGGGPSAPGEQAASPGAAPQGAAPQFVSLEQLYGRSFQTLELFSVAVFTVEYLLRLFSITADSRYSHPLWGRIRYALTPMALVDLASILPTYFQTSGFIAARALRLVRIFRIFKLGHYSTAVKSLNRALVSKRAELSVTVFVIGILLVLVSTGMYYAENGEQPDKFSSIPATMWWGIVTLTTVGYGDISPITPWGKLLGGVVSIFGIGIVALPAGILGSAFIQEMEAVKKAPPRCPHCGKEI